MAKFVDPVILFFMVGLLAGFCKSNLTIPNSISRFLSMYLLMALGLKGGFALAATGLNWQVALSLLLALALAIILPIAAFALLKRYTSQFDAAAIAATYGSVSAVTFITATQALEGRGIEFGGHMAAAMALMEAPAILYAIIIANSLRRKNGGNSNSACSNDLKHVIKESLSDGTQFLLIGSLLVGYFSGENGLAAMKPFSVDLFKGLLAFFLLDMGLCAAKNWPSVRQQRPALLGYALFAPLLHAGFALALAWLIDAELGNAILLMCLAASASYIAVPAALRESLPEANSSLYLGMSLGITFPFNIMAGIPIYIALAQWLYH